MKTSVSQFKQLMNNIFTSGMYEDYDIEIMRKIIMINIMTIIALIIFIPLGIVDVIKGSFTNGFFVLIVAAVLIFNQFHLRKSGNYMYTIYCGISIVAAYFFYALVTGGVNNTGYLWYFTFPLFTLFLLGPKRGSIVTLLLLLPSIVFLSIDTISPFFTTYTIDFKIRFMVSFLVVFGYLYLFETLREKARLKLSQKNAELTEIVTKLKEAENALRRSRDHLEELVKERTAELQESEDLYRTLFMNNPIETITVDVEGRVTGFNKAKENTAKQRSGGRLPDVEDRMYTEDYAGKHKINMRAELMDCIESGKSKEFTELEYDDIVWNIHISPFTGGAIITSIDTTSRNQAEKALKESEEKYRTILENIEDGYYEVDIAGNFTFFNDSICKTFGYTNDELMGMNNRECTEKETAKRLYKTFNRVYKTGKPTRIVDFEIMRKDVTRRHVEASVSLMKDLEGNATGFRGIVRDITSRKKAEKEKINLESQLLQAQKMEAIGTLAGGIAHNFNNLLMGIQGNTSLMLLDIPSDHPHYERLTTIEKSVRSGSKLTSQLLGYARGGRYEVKPISINHSITETSATFAMTRKDITLHHDLEQDLAGVKADRGQMEQVILNIYVNAAEAMPQGGDLFVTTRNISHTEITGKSYTMKPGTYILLTIKDTGIGMDKHTQEKVFDPFFTTKGLARGTGLGLASVYGIMKAHAGYIDVESYKGTGTTFFLYLPASNKAIGEETHPAAPVETGKETILLVDDEEIILDVGEAFLTSLGYTVLTAHGGNEAIAILRTTLPSSPPDLVILDMIMPGMGGGDTYDRMKEIHPTIKVLLSSGYSIDGQATEILKRGCNGFLQKPFTLAEVSKAIREVVGEG